MVIAVVAMWMMQVTVYQIVHVVAMRHGLMTAAWPVGMVGSMRCA